MGVAGRLRMVGDEEGEEIGGREGAVQGRWIGVCHVGV